MYESSLPTKKGDNSSVGFNRDCDHEVDQLLDNRARGTCQVMTYLKQVLGLQTINRYIWMGYKKIFEKKLNFDILKHGAGADAKLD